MSVVTASRTAMLSSTPEHRKGHRESDRYEATYPLGFIAPVRRFFVDFVVAGFF